MLFKPKISRYDRLKSIYKKTKSPEAKAALACYLIKHNMLDEAKELLSDRSYHPDEMFALAKLHIVGKDLDVARELLEKVVEQRPYYFGARKLLCSIYIEQEDMDAARRELSFLSAFVSSPDIDEMLNEIGGVEIVDAEDEGRVVVLDDEIELEEIEEEKPDLVESSESVSDETKEEADIVEDEFLTIEMVKSLVQQCLFEEAYENLQKILVSDPDNEEALKLKEQIERYLSLLTPDKEELADEES